MLNIRVSHHILAARWLILLVLVRVPLGLPVHAATGILYFGYGSNLNDAHMLGIAPDAVIVDTASLPGWSLVLDHISTVDGSGKGDIVTPATTMVTPVQGVVWSLTASDVSSLDSSEGSSYQHISLNVISKTTGASLSVYAYAEISPQGIAPPSLSYETEIIQGALENLGLPYTTLLHNYFVSLGAPTIPDPACTVGDYDHDGAVNIMDLSIFALHYNTRLGQAAYGVSYDLNDDNRVELTDLSIFALHYGMNC